MHKINRSTFCSQIQRQYQHLLFLYFTSVINRRFKGLKDLGHCYPHVKLSQSQLIHEVGQLKGQNIKNSNTCYGTRHQSPERRKLIKLKEWTELKCHQWKNTNIITQNSYYSRVSQLSVSKLLRERLGIWTYFLNYAEV